VNSLIESNKQKNKKQNILVREEDDMNIDINENDCIVIETKGSDSGKRSAGLAGSKNPADAAASAPSSEPGKVAVEDRGE
jgi:hypothetical protein